MDDANSPLLRKSAGMTSEQVGSSEIMFGTLCVLLSLGSYFAASSWVGYHAAFFGVVGVLMLVFPSVTRLPGRSWILALAFFGFGMASLLPSSWFFNPPWRAALDASGIQTGKQVAIQSKQAFEGTVIFGITLLIAMWMAGHRPTPSQSRRWTMIFVIAVATYALISKGLEEWTAGHVGGGWGHFGFFPNRNHTATYLSMGAVCGMGCVIQALRDKKSSVMTASVIATGTCLWAVAEWSISRAGIVLIGCGGAGLIAILGRQYLGKQGSRIVVLGLLLCGGLFLLGESRVKERIEKTTSTTLELGKSDSEAAFPPDKPAAGLFSVDFRIPTAADTLSLIRDFKWTGIGAGQFYYVFPQYRQNASIANDTDSFHPESDWLWMAAELGVPATLALGTLILLAGVAALASVRRGTDRALRAGCIVAALLVPLHGIFDVPGHRITLALSAAYLYMLSNRVSDGEGGRASRRAPWRIAAVLLIVAALFFANAEWGSGRPPALAASEFALRDAAELMKKDQALQQAALEQKKVYQPKEGDDLLEKALGLLQSARSDAPIDRSLLRYQAFLGLHFDDKQDFVQTTGNQELILDPSWVNGPLMQSRIWLKTNPRLASSYFDMALARASDLDRIHPGTKWSFDHTLARIRSMAKGIPELESELRTRLRPQNH